MLRQTVSRGAPWPCRNGATKFEREQASTADVTGPHLAESDAAGVQRIYYLTSHAPVRRLQPV